MKWLLLFLLSLLINSINVWAEPHFPEGSFLYQQVENKMVIGVKNFEKIRHLAQTDSDREISKKIAHLRIENTQCTGFLIASDLLLTNHHCVYDAKNHRTMKMEEIDIYMNYLDDNSKGKIHSGVKQLLKINKQLDYALLRLDKKLGHTYGWLELDRGNETLNGAVKVIQHPRGRSKEIARQQSAIVGHFPTALHYIADTDGGSSGSPVFLLQGNVVIALHHVGTKQYNEGILIRTIVPEIRNWLMATLVPQTVIPAPQTVIPAPQTVIPAPQTVIPAPQTVTPATACNPRIQGCTVNKLPW